MHKTHNPYHGAIPAGYEDDLDEDEFYLDSIEMTTKNLKITVVPHITTGACLNGDDFVFTLSGEMENWFDTIREMWNTYKKSPATTQRLQTLFSNDPNPLLLALQLFASSPGCNNLKNKNLALFVLESICDLRKRQPEIGRNCDDNTRMIAFNFVKTCGILPLYKAVMDTYELQKIRDHLIPKLQQMVDQGHYKDAAYWCMYLQLTHLFGLYDLIFPLILQDKTCLAEEYLKVAKNLQLPTVLFLDSLLHRHKSVMELVEETLQKYNYRDIKHNILEYRPMSKLVTRLCKKYKIDDMHTPNLNFTKSCSYLHYLYRKYLDGGMSCESWRELVQDAASSKPLQLDLITNIVSHGGHDEASYWAQFFEIPADELPSSLQQELKLQPSAQHKDNVSTDTVDAPIAQNANIVAAAATKPQHSPQQRKHYRNQQQAQQQHHKTQQQNQNEFLSLELPFSNIHLIDTNFDFLSMLDDLAAQGLVAFDSEWKPTVCNNNMVSLLQLSTSSRVYLIDCLSPNLDEQLWRQLGKRIFNNLEILKIGFSLHQDLSMLQKSLPLQLNLQANSCYLDLHQLWRRLKYIQATNELPFGRIADSKAHVGESLCALTELCLGKKLDKSNQFSNWANRPLRHDQMVYAALDAYCLIQIYYVIAEVLLRMNMNIEQVVEEITTSKTGYMASMKRSVVVLNNSSSQQHSQAAAAAGKPSLSARQKLGVHNIKFMCDSMLLGLAKELRKLGIDCLDISPNNLSEHVEVAKREQRLVLTRNARYAVFLRELPETQCIQIPSDSNVNQVLNILGYFGIEIYEQNLFTRCLLCNSNDFILALREEMQLLCLGELLLDETQAEEAKAQPHFGKIVPKDKTLNLLELSAEIKNNKTTHRGKPIKTHRIKPHILRSKQHFYICDNCGICTWDGAHPLHSSIMQQIVSANTSLAAVSASASASSSLSTASQTPLTCNSKATP